MALEGHTRYDQIGNRLTEVHDGQTDTYTYLPNLAAGNSPILDEVQQLGGTRTFTFGAAGHQEAVNNAGNLIDFDSDEEGRLAQLSRSGNVATFLYDGRSFLARAEEMATGNTTDPTYSSTGLLYSLSHSQNGVPPITLEHVLYFAGRPVAIVTVPPTGLVTQTFLSTDHLGTPFVATDDNAGEIWAGGFEPFGKDWQAGLAGGAQENGVFLRFPGQWFDEVWEASSLGAEGYYNVYRWYQNDLGSYSRVDPLLIGRNFAPYLYAAARPTHWIDPKGLQALPATPLPPSVPPPGPTLVPPQPPVSCKPPKIGLGRRVLGAFRLGGAAATVILEALFNPQPAGRPGVDDLTDPSCQPKCGNCSGHEIGVLQYFVDQACKTVKSRCTHVQSPDELYANYLQNLECFFARKEINDRCFAGKVDGHNVAADNARIAAINCLDLLTRPHGAKRP